MFNLGSDSFRQSHGTLNFNVMNRPNLKYPIFSLLIALTALLWSCEPAEILIMVQPAPSEIVVASQVLPGDYMAVLLTRSFSALEGNEDSLSADFLEQILIKDAEVILSSKGQEYVLPPFEDVDGVYVSEIPIDLDTDSVTLSVFDIAKNRKVTSITPVLPLLAPDTVRFIEEIVDQDTIQSLIYSFTDPTGDHWYSISGFDPGGFADGIVNNPFNFNGGDNGIFYDALISDQVIQNNHYADTIKLDTLLFSDTIAFLFSNVSEDYFRFLDSRQRTGGIIASATSEPINTPTNIQGGLGFFNVHKPSITLIIKEE